MLNGICGSCGAATVHVAEDGVRFDDGNVRLKTSGPFPPAVSVVDYVCVTCGYLERHLSGAKSLASIAAKWDRVPPQDGVTSD